MKDILINGLIKFLTITAFLAQLLSAFILLFEGEIKFAIFCALAAAMLAYYFIELVKRES